MAAAAALALLAACSPDGGGGADRGTQPPGAAADPSDAPAAAEDGAGQVRVVAAEAGPAVLPGPDAATTAVQASAALVEASPVVVLADAAESADPAALAPATARATDLGVPLLLTAGATTADGPLAAELARLGTTHALAVGPAAEEAAAGLDVEVVTDAADLPRLRAAEPVAGTVVLTTGDPADAAALATAAAAGAVVVPVATGDPRAEAGVVEALAAAAPTRVVALGEEFGAPEVLTARVAAAATGVQLPGGGQLVLPGKRYVALYGHPGTAALGLLGEQDLAGAVERAQDLARTYRSLSTEQVLPTFEVITTVASAGAGKDGNYSNEVDPEFLRPWVEEAGRQGVYVLLDLQPGTTDFLTQAKRYETLLQYPHVGLALDPEWRLEPGQRHMEQIGSVSAAEVNEVSAWLAGYVREQHLPQKMLVLHQFRTDMITDITTLQTGHDEVAVVIHADGNGSQGAKNDTWRTILANAPAGVAFAWKNFVDEDSPMLTPEQTMAVEPTPVLVSYQ
jgi:hypothetical protein